MAPQPKKLRKLAVAAAAAKSLQSCLTLCDPIDSSPPGSPVPRILQARTLEWVAISFSNTWKWKVKVKSLSRVRLLATPWTAAQQAPPPMGFSRQEYWSGVPLPSPGNWLMDTSGLGWVCLREKWVGVHTILATDSGETWGRRGWGDMKSVYWCWLHLPVLHSFVFLHCFSSLAFSVLLDGHSKSMCFVLSIRKWNQIVSIICEVFCKILFLWFFNWSILELQYCVNFTCREKWFYHACVYIYIAVFFKDSFPLYNILSTVPCAPQ